MQVETTRRYLLIPATEAKIEKTGNTRSWLGYGETGTHGT
jgi:hypothetical protein